MAVPKNRTQHKDKKNKTSHSSKSTATATRSSGLSHITNESSSSTRARGSRMGIVSIALSIAVIAASILWNDSILSRDKSNKNNHRWDNFDSVATLSLRYKIIKQYNHDPKAFTQGLFYHPSKQRLIESTGMHGESLVRIWDPETGVIDQESKMESKFFGEGLTWYTDGKGNRRIIVLTWQERTAFIYDENLGLLRSFEYTTHTTEGWGITFDPLNRLFYVSDGSEYILVWDLQFQEVRRFSVSLKLKNSNGEIIRDIPALKYLNELEWDPSDNTILANIWYQNAIIRIHSQTGQVLKVYDFSELYTDRDGAADVMNGIAIHKSIPHQLWITGKYWPNLYLIELLE